MGSDRFEVKEIETARGQQRWQVSGYKPDGTRVRVRFDTVEEAQGKKSELEIEALNLQNTFTLRRTRLTDTQLLEAESAYARLDGLSLTTVVECGLRHYQARLTTVTVEAATKTFMAEKEHGNRRNRTLGSYRQEFARLNAIYGERPVSEIGPDDLRALVYRGVNPVPVTINHRIERLHAFFAWCERNRYCLGNPVTFPKATVDHGQPQILNNTAVKHLLWAAMNYKDGILVPYCALSLFTAMRPNELGRFSLKDALEHQEQSINLEGHVAKGRKSRLVDVQKNLPAWIRYRPDVPISGPNFRKHFDKVREMAGFRIGKRRDDPKRPAWTPDVLRHTALSNYFAVNKDEKETARWGGNSPDTLHKHYRRNVNVEAATEYWNITPESLKTEFGVLAAAA